MKMVVSAHEAVEETKFGQISENLVEQMHVEMLNKCTMWHQISKIDLCN